MRTFLLLHGAGSTAWYWHRVAPLLDGDVVAPDLPTFDEAAGLGRYIDVALRAAGQPRDLTIVAQSLAGFVGPVVADRLGASSLVLVNAMVPQPGETAGEWWDATGHKFPDPFDEFEVFLHDVPEDVRAAAGEHAGPQAGRVFEDPFPLDAWPDVPTRAIVSRGDRFFPEAFQRRVLRERLGLEPELIDGGHTPALSRPAELAAQLTQ